MERIQVARTDFTTGLNCCQSVVGAFSDELGLDKEAALKLASGFGGGLKLGEVCGVVTGAIMTIGLKYGYISSEDMDNKEKSAELTKKFHEMFVERFGNLRCKDLLGYDVSKEEDAKYLQETKLTKEICPKFVDGAIEILEEIL